MILQELDKGVTYAELEERSTDPTTGQARISDSQLHRLAKGTATRIPTQEQLRGVAAAVRMPYETVRLAAIAQWVPADNADHEAEVIPFPAFHGESAVVDEEEDAFVRDIMGRRGLTAESKEMIIDLYRREKAAEDAKRRSEDAKRREEDAERRERFRSYASGQ